MGATGKRGKLKATSSGTFSTTGTKPSDWGVDPMKPYTSSGPSQKVETLHLHQARRPTTKDVSLIQKGTNV